MKAVGFIEPGAVDRPDALLDFELEKPIAYGHDLLVEVEAISVNPVDTKIRKRGNSAVGEPQILGWDAAGTVIGVGTQVRNFNIGDRVYYAGTLNRPGTNCEFHLVDERIVGRMPTSITAAAAAAMPLTTLTAYEMLFERLDINKPVPGGSDTLLVIGGAGGVGSIAIQLARCLSDVTIIATASRPETKAWAKELGADYVIDHSKELAPQMLELGFRSVDFVYSTTHSQMYAEEVVSMMTPQGRYGLIDGPDVFDVVPFKSKAISIHWEFMFTRPMFETADMQRQGEILNEVASLIDAGTIKSTITNNLGRINAVNLLEAHRLIESGSTRGKIVLAKF